MSQQRHNYYTNPAFCQKSEFYPQDYPVQRALSPERRHSPVGAQKPNQIETYSTLPIQIPIPTKRRNTTKQIEDEEYEEMLVDDGMSPKQDNQDQINGNRTFNRNGNEENQLRYSVASVDEVENRSRSPKNRYEYIPMREQPQKLMKQEETEVKPGRTHRYAVIPVEEDGQRTKYTKIVELPPRKYQQLPQEDQRYRQTRTDNEDNRRYNREINKNRYEYIDNIDEDIYGEQQIDHLQQEECEEELETNKNQTQTYKKRYDHKSESDFLELRRDYKSPQTSRSPQHHEQTSRSPHDYGQPSRSPQKDPRTPLEYQTLPKNKRHQSESERPQQEVLSPQRAQQKPQRYQSMSVSPQKYQTDLRNRPQVQEYEFRRANQEVRRQEQYYQLCEVRRPQEGYQGEVRRPQQVVKSPQTPRKGGSLEATQKLHELLITPQKFQRNTSTPPKMFSPVAQRTPSVDPFQTPSKSPPRGVQRAANPRAQQKLNYALSTRQGGCDKRLNNTAVIAPICSSPVQSVYSETTFSNKTESWMNISGHKAPVQASLAVAAIMMMLCGGVSSGLCFYMVSVVGRMYYLDFGIVSGFACLLLGCLGFRSRNCHWLPNRNYISGSCW